MRATKLKFYHNGTDNQKKADVVIDLHRVDLKKIATWTDEQKEAFRDFMFDARRAFEDFYEQATSHL